MWEPQLILLLSALFIDMTPMLNLASGEGDLSPHDQPPSLALKPQERFEAGGSSMRPRPLSTDQAPLINPWRMAKTSPEPRLSLALLAEPAAPLSPMRDRDLVAMQSWFDDENMPEVEKDVNYRLLLLFPEPYWEEDDWAFLHNFL